MRTLMFARRGLAAAMGLAVAMGGAGALSSCSWLHFGEQDETYDYRKAKPSQQPLEVPPDLSQLPKDDRYSVPAGKAPAAGAAVPGGAPSAAPGAVAPAAALLASTAGAAAPSAAAPAGVVVVPTLMGATIVRDGCARWLAADVSPEVAYVTIKDLWVSMGLTIKTDEPAIGLLETAWSEIRPDVKEDALRNGLHRLLGAFDSNGEENKYRARIERTAADTSVITITHRGLVEVFTSPMQDTTKWVWRPSDPELEAEMLQRIAMRFAAVQPLHVAVAAPAAGAAPVPAAVPAALAAEALVTAPPAIKVHKVTVGGVETLQIEDTLDRTWRKVGIALDRGGFTVEGRNREKNLFLVRYLDPDYEIKEREKRSWWDRMFNSDAKVPEQQFQIAVSANGPTTIVEVQDKDGHPDGGATARRIVDQLMEQLR